MPKPAPDSPAKNDVRRVRRALLSVADKSGLTALAAALHQQKVALLASGGTAAALQSAKIPVTPIEDWTGAPPMLGGRVKTLHPKLHGSLLARAERKTDAEEITRHALQPIDLLVVNLYPFAATLAAGGSFAECVEQIDIGGPAMLRAAAKNMSHVCVLTEPQDYALFLAAWRKQGGTDLALRRRLAQKAFAHASLYDSQISQWLARTIRQSEPDFTAPLWTAGGRLRQNLRYGENPHQRAAFYAPEPLAGLARATQVQGKPLSYNNFLDADAAQALARDLPTDRAACVIVKHANPCGVGLGQSLHDAFVRARACDPTSAFGGIIACNRKLDADTARAIAAMFSEVIVAPEADADAREALARKKNLRLLLMPLTDDGAPPAELRSVAGGVLVQTRDESGWPDSARCVSQRAPSPQETEDLRLAWCIVKHVKSNAIVLVKQRRLLGVGAGQMNRLESVALAIRKAQSAGAARPPRQAAAQDPTLQKLGETFKPAKDNGGKHADMSQAAPAGRAATAGAVMASDAFFPFADGLERAANAGITAVVQPGGSLRDGEVIAAADKAGIAMLFTGERHFRH